MRARTRIVTYGGAVSLDGFLTATDGSLDWLHFSGDVQRVMADYWKTVDTVLMGRKTYAVAAAQAPRGRRGKPTASDRKAPCVRTYVFSRTLRTVEGGAELVRGDAVEFVRRLKAQDGGNICLMGGGELAQSLLAADLVDEVGLNVHPILLGSGTPAFRDPGHRVRLVLQECRTMDGGCVLLTYRRAKTAGLPTEAPGAKAGASGGPARKAAP